MEFIKTEGTAELEVELIDALNGALSRAKPVVWLVSGGSNIAVAVKIMTNLESENLEHLTVVLTDERFGTAGHKDSNFYQLHQAGFIERGASFVDLLYGGNFEETTKVAADAMEHIFLNASTIIGLLGMGADGHIAGILPHSPSAITDEAWMIGYDGGQFQRLTLTPFALSHVQIAFVGAFGLQKHEALANLHDKMLLIEEQPAQILRHIPVVRVFNDQVEGAV
jgi:6-phosphogluconolactonase/glucosamine-6-phosphate isomerase/deaminase